MKTTHSNPVSADLGEVRPEPLAQPLKICVVFDDAASARSAEVLIHHAASNVPCEIQSFAFAELDPPGPGVTAARNACDSDILVVAVRDGEPLPGHMELWLGLCLGLRDQDLGGVLLALVRKVDEVTAPDSSLIEYLKTVATIGGLAFFPRRAPRSLDEITLMDELRCQSDSRYFLKNFPSSQFVKPSRRRAVEIAT